MRLNLKAHLIRWVDFSRESIRTYCGLTLTRERLRIQRTQMRACKSCMRIMFKESGTSRLHTGMF